MKISITILSSFYPHNRTICGLTQGSTGAHLARAALEAVCFQTREILDSMQKDSGIVLNKLQVDGGMTGNNTLLQLQADIAGVPVGKEVILLGSFVTLYLYLMIFFPSLVLSSHSLSVSLSSISILPLCSLILICC